MSETTTHLSDPDGLGRLPKTLYAVKFKGTNGETGRKKTFIFTHERKPNATRHHAVLEKLVPGGEVELLEGTVTWESPTTS